MKAKLQIDRTRNAKANGIISYEDLTNYQAKERKADVFNYKGNTIVTMPLPSSGGVILQQMMGMIAKRILPS